MFRKTSIPYVTLFSLLFGHALFPGAVTQTALGILLLFILAAGEAGLCLLAYLVALFFPTGLAPVAVAGYVLQPLDVFWIVGTPLMAVRSLKDGTRFWHRAFWRYALLAVTAAVLVALFKGQVALGENESRKVAVYTARFLMYSLTSLLLADLVRKTGLERALRLVFWTTAVLVLSGLVERVLIGLGQYALLVKVWTHLGIRFFTIVPHGGSSIDWERVVGLIGSPETYGLVLSQLLPLAFCYRYVRPQASSADGARWRTKLLDNGLIALGLAAIAFSGTRTAFLGLLVVLGVFFLLARVRLRLPVMLGLFGIGLALSIFYAEPLWIRFNELLNGQSGNWLWRKNIWNAAQEIWRRDPWTGHGFGAFELIMERDFGSLITSVREEITLRETGIYDTACSLYWQLLTDVGVIGLIAFAVLFLQTSYQSYRLSRQAKGTLGHNVALAVFGLTLWNIFYGFTNGSIFLVRGATFLQISLFWLQLAFLQVACEGEEKNIQRPLS